MALFGKKTAQVASIGRKKQILPQLKQPVAQGKLDEGSSIDL